MGASDGGGGETPEFAEKLRERIDEIVQIAENPEFEVVAVSVAGGDSYDDYCKNYEEAMAQHPGGTILFGISQADGGMTWTLQVPKQDV